MDFTLFCDFWARARQNPVIFLDSWKILLARKWILLYLASETLFWKIESWRKSPWCDWGSGTLLFLNFGHFPAHIVPPMDTIGTKWPFLENLCFFRVTSKIRFRTGKNRVFRKQGSIKRIRWPSFRIRKKTEKDILEKSVFAPPRVSTLLTGADFPYTLILVTFP